VTAQRRATILAIVFFVVYAAAVTFPGAVPFRGPRPFLLGMPLALVWTAAWVVAAFFVLIYLDRAYSAAERADAESITPPEA
jgi:uncharacterized membrane protein YozB (DUF420 family)